jgi:hypothetical protein
MPAGIYRFESGPYGLNIVRVFSKDREKLFYQGFTTALVHPVGHRVATFGEAATGTPKPMLAWYPIGTMGAHGLQYP